MRPSTMGVIGRCAVSNAPLAHCARRQPSGRELNRSIVEASSAISRCMAISRVSSASWINDTTSRNRDFVTSPDAEMEPVAASGSIKSRQEPARQIKRNDHFYGQATLRIAAGYQRRCAMDKTPQDPPLTTDRRSFLGAATAIGAIAATAGQGTAFGVSAAHAQAPAGGASRAPVAGPVLTQAV